MKDLVIISGPTAVGKTELSVKLAKRAGAEIISADSMQVYRKMDIGTAKIRPEEMCGVRHHLIDILDPADDFNVYMFKDLAKSAIDDISGRGRIPFLVGGTGFYIQSVLYDIDFSEEDEFPEYADELWDLIGKHGGKYVHDMLLKVDEKAAKKIHYNDHKRIVRALCYYRRTGRRISEHNEESSKKESPYNYCYFVLCDDRAAIYDRIDKRVDKMMEAGLVDEVKALLDMDILPDCTAMQGLGYRQTAMYLTGKCSYDDAVYMIKRDSRHFAKRQMTWFKREKDVIFININEPGDIIEKMMNELEKKGIRHG